MKLKVLYVQHTGTFSGAAKSLLELIRAFPSESVEATVLTQKGPATDEFQKANIEVIPVLGVPTFNHAKVGYYRWQRWGILLREFFYLPFFFISVVKNYKKISSFDLLHLNEINQLPALLIVKCLVPKIPVILHARSVQETQHGPLRISFYKCCLEKLVDKTIAIDNDVLSSLPYKENACVVHNGLKLKSIDTERVLPQNFSQERPMNIIFIGNLLHNKGILDLVNCAKLCQDANLNIQFSIVGARQIRSGFLNKVLKLFKINTSAAAEAFEFVKVHNLLNIDFHDFQNDIETYIRRSDVVCFPSHLDAVGRPVIEGALLAKPCILAMSKTQNDVFVHNETGLCFEPKNVDAFYKAAKYFYENPHEIKRMGGNAQTLANNNFDITKNALKVLELYKELSASNRSD